MENRKRYTCIKQKIILGGTVYVYQQQETLGLVREGLTSD